MDPENLSDELYSTIYALRLTSDDNRYQIHEEQSIEGMENFYKTLEERIKEVDEALREETTLVLGESTIGQQWLNQRAPLASETVTLYTEEDLDRKLNLFQVREIDHPEMEGYQIGPVGKTLLIQEESKYEETVPAELPSYHPKNVRLEVPTQEAFEKEISRQLEEQREAAESQEEADRELIDNINVKTEELEELLERTENRSRNVEESEDNDEDRDMDLNAD